MGSEWQHDDMLPLTAGYDRVYIHFGAKEDRTNPGAVVRDSIDHRLGDIVSSTIRVSKSRDTITTRNRLHQPAIVGFPCGLQAGGKG